VKNRFTLYAWSVVAYNLLVVLWGAFVRATGSGAGCGSHWPLCDGEMVPRAPRIETIIEYTHRLTSGLALLAVVVLLFWAMRAFPRGHRVRRAAGLSTVFILIEAALGAGLVLFEYVAQNASAGRAVYLSAHLLNTQVLLGALAATAWFSHRPDSPGLARSSKPVLAAMAATLFVSMTGAVAALGDTLVPAGSAAAEVSPGAQALLRLRIFHPVIAVAAALFTWWMLGGVLRLKPPAAGRRAALAAMALVLVQLIAGAVNVVLLAPVWMQLVHLFLANLLWLALVVAMFEIPAAVRAPAAATAHA
jgi:heme A synthase